MIFETPWVQIEVRLPRGDASENRYRSGACTAELRTSKVLIRLSKPGILLEKPGRLTPVPAMRKRKDGMEKSAIAELSLDEASLWSDEKSCQGKFFYQVTRFFNYAMSCDSNLYAENFCAIVTAKSR